MYDLECQNTVSNPYLVLIEREYTHHRFINLRSMQSEFLINLHL
jgi:hypothetical protein